MSNQRKVPRWDDHDAMRFDGGGRSTARNFPALQRSPTVGNPPNMFPRLGRFSLTPPWNPAGNERTGRHRWLLLPSLYHDGDFFFFVDSYVQAIWKAQWGARHPLIYTEARVTSWQDPGDRNSLHGGHCTITNKWGGRTSCWGGPTCQWMKKVTHAGGEVARAVAPHFSVMRLACRCGPMHQSPVQMTAAASGRVRATPRWAGVGWDWVDWEWDSAQACCSSSFSFYFYSCLLFLKFQYNF